LDLDANADFFHLVSSKMAGKSWKMEVGAGKIIKLQTISGGFPSYV
jgi:hypothetical protein